MSKLQVVGRQGLILQLMRTLEIRTATQLILGAYSVVAISCGVVLEPWGPLGALGLPTFVWNQ